LNTPVRFLNSALSMTRLSVEGLTRTMLPRSRELRAGLGEALGETRKASEPVNGVESG
jgi:hypothetical protein